MYALACQACWTYMNMQGSAVHKQGSAAQLSLDLYAIYAVRQPDRPVEGGSGPHNGAVACTVAPSSLASSSKGLRESPGTLWAHVDHNLK